MPKPVDWFPNEDPKISSFDDSPPRHVHRTYLEFVKSTFASLKDTPRNGWYYDSDPELTKINIGATTPMDAKQVAGRPAVIVDLQGVDASGGIIGSFDNIDPFTGRLILMELWRGSLLAYAISKAPAEAQEIGWFLAEMTWLLQRKLTSNGGIHTIGGGIRMGPALPPGSLVGGDARGPLYAVPVAIPYTFIRRSAVTPVNVPKLNRINMHIRPSEPPTAADRQAIPPGWTVESWIAGYNRQIGAVPPDDPYLVPPPLPTEEGPGRQSGGEVVVRVDLIK